MHTDLRRPNAAIAIAAELRAPRSPRRAATRLAGNPVALAITTQV